MNGINFPLGIWKEMVIPPQSLIKVIITQGLQCQEKRIFYR
jgi:hypothetical protein